MAQIKHAQIRFRVIDKAIRNELKPYPTKEDLRQSCEEALFGSVHGNHICDSTIEKDLFNMRMDHDAPIKYSKKDKGYFYEDADYTIDNIPLSGDDVEALKFATNTLLQFKNVPIFNQFEFAMQKILDRVEVSQQMKPKETDVVQFEQGNNSETNNDLTEILAAIQDQYIIKFEYQSFTGGTKKWRNFEPYLLKEYRNRWYCIGYDEEKEKIITYALDRVENLLITEQKHRQKHNFNPDDFFKHTVGITVGSGNPDKVIFKADNVAAKYIKSQPFHNTQKVVKEGNKRTTFELEVWVTEELIRSFMSYGGEIEVKKPKSLESEIKQRVAMMMKVYS